MEMTDAATHLASGGAGVVSMGYIAKVLIQNWIKKQEEKDKIQEQKSDKTAEALTAVAVELAKVGVRMEGLQRSADASTLYGEAIAVLKEQMKDLKKDFNGLGNKVRGLANGEGV